MLHSVYLGTGLLGIGNALHTGQLTLQLLELLVAQNLLLNLVLDGIQSTVAHRMDLGHRTYQQVVVVATLVQRANLTFLRIEDPLHRLTRRTQTGYGVLTVEHVLALLDSITELSGVLLKVGQSLVLTHILAELVISVGIGLLGEIDCVLHNGHVILIDHSLASGHLKDDVARGERQVLQVVNSQRLDTVQVVLRILIHRGRVLVHGGGQPLLLTFLTVLLGQSLEIGTGLQSVIHTVGCLLGGLGCGTANLDLTVLDRVGSQGLREKLHHIVGVV